MNISQNPHAFLSRQRAEPQRGASIPDALSAVGPSVGGASPVTDAPFVDPRVPLQWQRSTGFRVAHFIAAAWVLVCLAVGIGAYVFAVRADRAAVATVNTNQ